MQTAAKPFIDALTEDQLKDLQEKWEEKLSKENEDNPDANDEDKKPKFELTPSIPMTPAADPLKILTFDAEVAKWQSQNLPLGQGFELKMQQLSRIQIDGRF